MVEKNKYPVLKILDSLQEVQQELKKIGVTPYGVTRMASKALFFVFKVFGVDIRAANILKQEMLSIGGEAAVSKGVIDYSIESTDVLLMGTKDHYNKLGKKLKLQPFGLKALSEGILIKIRNLVESKPTNITSRGKVLFALNRTIVMGVINVTPDSFSDGGKFYDPAKAVDRAQQLYEEGADIIDVGGESSRPYSEPIDFEEELRRVIPVVKSLKGKTNLPVSLDTYKSRVAERALDEGVDFVNDISGLHFDNKLGDIIATYKAGVILMHIRGTPKTMQNKPYYSDLMGEVCCYLEDGVRNALNAGIEPSSIMVDPGIGFGKITHHNLEILKRLPELKALGYPILVGTSRKSFIGHVLDKKVTERLEGTKATLVAAILNGASAVRIHDVKESIDVIKMADAIKYAGDWKGEE